MFDEYRADTAVYQALERHFSEFFQAEIKRRHADATRMKTPYYKTTFANGQPFFDGNPIFSAKHERTGDTLRVVLDEDIQPLSSYLDKEGQSERVIVGHVSALADIRQQVAQWIAVQLGV